MKQGEIPRFSTQLFIIAQELNGNVCMRLILVYDHHQQNFEIPESLRKVRMPDSEKGTVLAWRDATHVHDPVL